MNKDYIWVKRGLEFTKSENNIELLHGELPIGVYKPFRDINGWHLQKICDKFNFPYKIYDIENDFIDHVLVTWNNTNRNLGVLLNGIKGTGKSVTGKILANKLNIPIVLIDKDDEGLVDYIKEFDFNCVLFFDEYEKTFEENQDAILTIMDGMFSEFNRKFFILTTNEPTINENLIARPSRIRYFKEFNNISLEVINSYLEDNLKDLSRKKEIFKFIDSLETVSIDIIKEIVNEINLHNCSIDIVQEYMNLTKKVFRYKSYTAHSYESCSVLDERFSFETFIKAIGLIGKSYKSEDGTSSKYSRYELDLSSELLKFDKPVEELKVGDYLDRTHCLKILEIKNGMFRCDDQDRYEFFIYPVKFEPSVSLYGNELVKYII